MFDYYLMTSVSIGLQYEEAIRAEPSHSREPEPVAGRDRRAAEPDELTVASRDRRAAEPDELTVARLTGAAWRHASGREPTDAETAAAVTELTQMAGGRGDLLAEVAGLLMGFYRHTAEQARAEAAARHCIAAGADLDLIPRWIEEGRRRAAVAQRTSGTGSTGCEDHLGASV